MGNQIYMQQYGNNGMFPNNMMFQNPIRPNPNMSNNVTKFLNLLYIVYKYKRNK